MNDNKQKMLFERIGIIIIIANILMLNIFVGSNQNSLMVLQLSISLFAMIVYLLILKFKNKKSIFINNKIDIVVLLFVLSTVLPLIFKKYCSLQGSVEFIMKYFYVYVFYIFVRNIADSEKKVTILMNTMILCSLIPILIGLFNKYYHLPYELMKILKITSISKERFKANFGYSNAVSIYLTFCIFVAIYRIENCNKNILKILYLLYILLSLFIIYISLSRSIFLLCLIGIISFIFLKLFKMKKYGLLKSFFVICVCAILYVVCIGMRFSKPFITEEKKSNIELKYNFKEHEKYKMKLFIKKYQDINEEDLEKEKFNVQIIEKNIYYVKKQLTNKSIKFKDDYAEIDFETGDDILSLNLIVNDINKNHIEIDKILINDKEYIVNYKYMPKALSRLVTSFFVTDDSIVQRKQMYRDCIKIFKKSPLLGHGGNTWKTLATSVSEYPYKVKESHSYFFEILISYGIIGVFLLVLMTTLIFMQILKDINLKKSPLIIGFTILVIHSFLFDFEMSFVLILATFFEYIAILTNKSEKVKDSYRVVDILIMFACICIFILYLNADIAEYCVKSDFDKMKLCSYNRKYRYEYIMNTEDLDMIKEMIQKEPYYKQTFMYHMYWNSIISKVDEINDEEFKKYAEFGIDKLKNTPYITPMYAYLTLERENIIANKIRKMQKYDNRLAVNLTIEQLKEILKKDYQDNINNIRDTNRNGLDEESAIMYEAEFCDILDEFGVEH